MFLSVQQAARRLGVSPVTIRRWTATGFLPCSRTAGGHRRIDERDIDAVLRGPAHQADRQKRGAAYGQIKCHLFGHRAR